MVDRITSNSPRWLRKNSSSSPVASTWWAPSSYASFSLRSEREITVTSAPFAAAICTPMWPSPPSPTMATLSPSFTFQRASGP